MQIRSRKIRSIVYIFFLIIVTFFCKPNSVEGASVVRTDKDIYNQGEMIKVYFTNASGNDSDWICIVPIGYPDTDAGDYKYMPGGLSQGLLLFNPRSPGVYEVRAYYNYRRNGYVVSDRYAFSVTSDPAKEEPFAQYVEPIVPNYSLETNLPPPIQFAAPPELIVLPETYVYVVPDVDVDIFFYNGWWWRPWEGRWYRSRYYNRGWGYYNNVPSFYFDIDPGWRGYYRDRNWYGHRWDYERIPNQRLQQSWKGWQNNRRWERQGTWGVQNYIPQPQQQRQELRQQRQQQYQQRPQVQQLRPQVEQPRQQVQQPDNRFSNLNLRFSSLDLKFSSLDLRLNSQGNRFSNPDNRFSNLNLRLNSQDSSLKENPKERRQKGEGRMMSKSETFCALRVTNKAGIAETALIVDT